MIKFDELDFTKARKLLTDAMRPATRKSDALTQRFAYYLERPDPVASLEESRAFYDGDHFQGGRAWRGPQPAVNAQAQTVWEEIKRGFVSKNVIKEVVVRHRSALLGHEPMWTLSVARLLENPEAEPSAEEEALIDEVNAFLVKWWNDKDVLQKMQDAATPLLYGGRGNLRLFVPLGLTMDEGGNFLPPAGSLEECLDSIYVDTPEIESATVHLDTDTQASIGVYLFTDEDGNELLELTYLDGERTVLRTITKVRKETVNALVRAVSAITEAIFGNGETDLSAVFDFGGHLTMHQMKRDPVITEQVKQNQGLLNMGLTMLPRNVVLAGFLERIFLNVQRPTQKVIDATAEGGYREEEIDLPVGGGASTYATGVTYENESGNTVVANPSVIFRDPIPVKTFEDTVRIAYENILEEVHQKHVSISGDATSSGESRIQAKADFVVSLAETKAKLDAAGRWLLSTVLAMAAEFSGDTGRYKDIRIDFATKVDAGPLTSEERRQLMDEVEKRLRSRQSAMVLLGIEDPDAELAQIDDEKMRVGTLADIAAYVNAIRPEISSDEYLRLLDYNEEEIEEIKTEKATIDVTEGPEQ